MTRFVKVSACYTTPEGESINATKLVDSNNKALEYLAEVMNRPRNDESGWEFSMSKSDDHEW